MINLISNIVIRVVMLLFAICLAAPIVLRFGLFDFADTTWHTLLLKCSLVGVVVGALLAYRFIAVLLDNKREFSLYAILVGLVLTALTFYLGSGTHSSLRYCNDSDLVISTAVRYQPDRLSVVNGEFSDLAPGQCFEKSVNFIRTPVLFQISAVEQKDLAKWITQSAERFDFDSTEKLALIQGSDIPASNPNEPRSLEIRHETIDWRAGEMHRVNEITGPETPRSQNNRAAFISITPTSSTNYQHTVWFTKSGLTRTVEVCNLQPVHAVVDIYHRSKKREWKADYDIELPPGECREFTKTFQDVAPAFAVRSTIRGEVVKWFFNRRLVHFEGDKRVALCRLNSERTVSFHEDPVNSKCIPGKSRRYFFGTVPDKFADGAKKTFHLTFDRHEIPLPVKEGRIDVEKAKLKIRELAYLWPRRLKYMKAWDGREIPYVLCSGLDERLSHNSQGVVISKTCGDETNSFRADDVVMEFNGRPVFSPIDIEIYLKDFAEDVANGGVLKKFTYKVYRGNEKKGVLEEREGRFYFNERYWSTVENKSWDVLSSFAWGAAANIGLDNAVWLYCSRSENKELCTFTVQQRVMRLKQFRGTSFEIGYFVGETLIFVLATRYIGLVIGRTLVAEAAAGATVSALQEVAWLYEHSAPGENLNTKLKKSVLTAAGTGAALSILLRR